MDELLKMTLTELLQERVRLHGDRLAYRYTDRDYTRTYREFDEETDEIAKGFLAMGLKRGRPYRHLGAEHPGVGAHPVCHGENRRRARHCKYKLQGVRAGISAQAVGFRGACHGPVL